MTECEGRTCSRGKWRNACSTQTLYIDVCTYIIAPPEFQQRPRYFASSAVGSDLSRGTLRKRVALQSPATKRGSHEGKP